MYPDYIADDDSLMVTVFFQVCPGQRSNAILLTLVIGIFKVRQNLKRI